MADDIVPGSETFSKGFMKPGVDEEINALWGRKMAANDGCLAGTYGTLVLGSKIDGEWAGGEGSVNISDCNFTVIPIVQSWDANGALSSYQAGVLTTSSGSHFGYWIDQLSPTFFRINYACEGEVYDPAVRGTVIWRVMGY